MAYTRPDPMDIPFVVDSTYERPDQLDINFPAITAGSGGSGNRILVRISSAWVPSPMKVCISGVFLNAVIKRRVSGSWIPAGV